MHPQELEAEVPIAASTRRAERVSGPSDSSKDTGISSMSPIAEQNTPMAELDVREGGLGAGGGGGGSGSVIVKREEEEHIVSPNSDAPPPESMMGRARGMMRESMISSPTVSEATWTPTTPMQRRNSKFSEELYD